MAAIKLNIPASQLESKTVSVFSSFTDSPQELIPLRFALIIVVSFLIHPFRTHGWASKTIPVHSPMRRETDRFPVDHERCDLKKL